MGIDAVWKTLCEDLQRIKANLDDFTARKRAIDGLIIMARWLRSGGPPPDINIFFTPGIQTLQQSGVAADTI